MKKKTNTSGVSESSLQCAGIHELIDWEIVQYRRAVGDHRLDLSKAEGRCVAWQDAEQDFNSHDLAAMGEKWRVEYCGLICPQRNKCLTALHFLHSRKTEPLHKVG
ncbi:hypothetical protein PDESU_01508 [Pontiella desulfatans]|uniref:Uncharacterized protein n=1 Tax=Pontiella desulfatans TaxID=2750659 RepID=A0A6C2TZR7_PONDE|nr:hypothetical protein [Pontiella desulfatans]VGO12954.1 hypothetical protein PDESU_01508 [Pontiella desulfatans]